MSDQIALKAQARSATSKGAVRQLRAEGWVPAVIYGSNKEPETVAVDGHDIMMALQRGGFYTNAQTLMVDGKGQKVLPRDLQRDPVYGKILHADFLRFDPKRKITVMVHVRAIDEDKSPGIKKGGVLSLNRNEVELLCRADAIPQEVVVSMEGVDIGGSVHLSSANLPEGVQSTYDHDITIASILSTRTSKGADEGEGMGEGEEGEVAEGAEAEGSEESTEGESTEGKNE